jgi:two-component system, OmpR family, response regulator QseB
MAKILIVEDEQELAESVKEWLSEDYHLVETVVDGASALQALKSAEYDVIVLDWMLPGISGIEVCRQYRGDGGQAAILMLTAKKSLSSKEAALIDGADDYLTKPFQLRELSARIKALSRRSQNRIVEELTAGSLRLQRSTHRVFKGEIELRLGPKEFSLLELFMRFPDRVFNADDLLTQLWGTETEVVAETVRSTIKSLRKKIDDGDTSLIATVHGIGYKLESR